MKTVNSLSGGKTSSYIAANYPADYNVFSLVRIEDEKSKFPDKKIRQEVEDRIQAPFIATAEDDMIIYTMLDLEQHIGSKIDWVTGKTFDNILVSSTGKRYLPNVMQRFCTVDMKIRPIIDWWYNTISEPIEERIGFRANESRRANNMLKRCKDDGFIYSKVVTGKRGSRNKWTEFKHKKPSFPLIDDNIFKDEIESYWNGKSVRFAYMNNCVGCFHRSAALLKKMHQKHPSKLEWFAMQERDDSRFKKEFKYSDILDWKPQAELFDDDFNECDSGYCGL